MFALQQASFDSISTLALVLLSLTPSLLLYLSSPLVGGVEKRLTLKTAVSFQIALDIRQKGGNSAKAARQSSLLQFLIIV